MDLHFLANSFFDFIHDIGSIAFWGCHSGGGEGQAEAPRSYIYPHFR